MKEEKIEFLRSFCRSSPNFATDLLQTCYKRLKRGLKISNHSLTSWTFEHHPR